MSPEFFTAQVILTQGFNGNNVPADFDGDGFVDMVVSDVDVDIPGCNRRFTLLRNNDGQFMSDPNNGNFCLLYTSPSPRDATLSRMPSSA